MMVPRKNDLDEVQDMKLKTKIINMLKVFKQFKEDKNEHLNELREDRKKLSEVKKKQIWNTIQGMNKDFNKDIDILKEIQTEMKLEMKSSGFQI